MKLKNITEKIVHSFHLLFPGIITSIAIILISSGHIKSISIPNAIFIIAIIQWQLLGITICKMGMDNTSFIISIEHKNKKLDYYNSIIKYSLIPALVYTTFLTYLTSFAVSIVLLLTIITDTFSVVKTAELNGRKMFTHTNASNLLKTPLFLGIIIIISIFFQINHILILTIFLSCNILRFLFLHIIDQKDKKMKIKNENQIQMGIQQSLNYALFRIDQYIIVLPFIMVFLNQVVIGKILFLSKLCELISGLLVGLSALYLPYLNINNLTYIIKKYIIWYIIISLTLYSSMFTLYSSFWNHSTNISNIYILPFVIQSILILPANILTFIHQRNNNIFLIIKSSLISIFLGLLFFIIIFYLKSTFFITWIIPIQLSIYCFISLIYTYKQNNEECNSNT